MINDIQNILLAWGAWVNDSSQSMGCKSPSQMLINSAPFCDSESERQAKYLDYDPISDSQALKIDRIVALISKHAPAHAQCLVLKYVRGQTAKKTAQGYLTAFLYGDSGKMAGEHRVREYIAHTEGLIMGMLMNDI